jgi:hypothetical protein
MHDVCGAAGAAIVVASGVLLGIAWRGAAPARPDACVVVVERFTRTTVASAAARRVPILLRAPAAAARWAAAWDEASIAAAVPRLREVKRAVPCALGAACSIHSGSSDGAARLWVSNADAARPLGRRSPWSDNPRERNVSTRAFFARAARGEAVYVLADLAADEFAPLAPSLAGWDAFAVPLDARGGGGASSAIPPSDRKRAAVWMASSSAAIGVAAHYDVSHNWHYVMRGAKRFELWRPGRVAAAALPFAHPGFRSFARAAGGDVGAPGCAVAVAAGEMLYVPPLWPHRVLIGGGGRAARDAAERAAEAPRAANSSVAVNVWSASAEMGAVLDADAALDVAGARAPRSAEALAFLFERVAAELRLGGGAFVRAALLDARIAPFSAALGCAAAAAEGVGGAGEGAGGAVAADAANEAAAAEAAAGVDHAVGRRFRCARPVSRLKAHVRRALELHVNAAAVRVADAVRAALDPAWGTTNTTVLNWMERRAFAAMRTPSSCEFWTTCFA